MKETFWKTSQEIDCYPYKSHCIGLLLHLRLSSRRPLPPLSAPPPTHLIHTHCCCSVFSFFPSLLLVPALCKWMERSFPRERTHPFLAFHSSWSRFLQVGGVGSGSLAGRPSCWVAVHLPMAPVSPPPFSVQTGEGADAVLFF